MFNLISRYNKYLIDLSEGEVSDNTVLAYLTDVRYFLIYIKDKNLSDVIPKDIISFTGQPSFKKPYSLCSIKTRKRRFSSIRSFFNFLIDEGLVSFNPAILRWRMKARQHKYIPSFLKPFEVQRVEEVSDILAKTVVRLLYVTGIRLEEMRKCQLASVDFKKRELKVLGKGGKERYVPFPTNILPLLYDYLENWRNKYAKKETGELFVSKSGIALNKNQIEYMFRKLSKQSGITVRPHKLRHSFATDAISRKMPPKTLQKILGHESQITTDWYTHIEPDVRGDYDRAYP